MQVQRKISESRVILPILAIMGAVAPPMLLAQAGGEHLSAFVYACGHQPQQAFGLQPSIGLGVGVSYEIVERGSVFAQVERIPAHREFDMIGSTSRVSVSVYSAFAGFSYGMPVGFATLAPSVSIGVTSLTTSAMTVSLGALGYTEVPSRNERHFTCAAAVDINRSILPRLSLHLIPRVSFISVPSVQPNYTLAGGFSIGIL